MAVPVGPLLAPALLLMARGRSPADAVLRGSEWYVVVAVWFRPIGG